MRRCPFAWTPRAPWTRSSDTSVSGAYWRRFMFGYTSVPPATSMALGSSRSMRAASAYVAARTKRKRGRRSTLVGGRGAEPPDRLALACVGRCPQAPERALRIRLAVAEAVGTDAVLRDAPVVAQAERVEDLLRCDGRLVEAHADRVVHRVRDRGDDRVERSLARLLRAEGSFRVDRLHDDRFERGRVERGRQLVVEERRLLVQAAAEDLFLHDDLAVPHVRGAFDLPLDVRGVERAAAVVRRRELVDGKRAGLDVDAHLRDGRLVRVRRRRPDARAFEGPAEPLGRLVAPRRDERAVRGLGEHRGVGEGHEFRWVVAVVHAAVRREQALRRHAELLGRGLDDERAQLHRRILRRVAGHERHAAGVAAEVDRRERGVAGDDVHVLGEHAERFRGDRGEHHVRALADLARAAHDRHAAAAIDPDLRARVGHLVPVDGEAGARDVRAARDADALAPRQLPVLLAELRGALQGVEAFAKAHRRDAQLVHGPAVRRLEDALPVLERIEPQVHGDLVELALEPVPRLRRAVAALGPAGRLVRVHADAVELVRRDAVGDREKRAGVIGGRDPVGRVRAAVEEALVVDRGDLAILFNAGPDAHLHRVAPAVRVEDLFPVERELHRAARAQREERRRELVRERVALAAEGAAVRRGDDADPRARQAEHLLELAVQVVGDLRRGPEREPIVGAVAGDRGMRLDRRVRVALEEEPVVTDVVGGGEPGFEVAEAEMDLLEDVRALGGLVDLHVLALERLLDREDRLEGLVVDVDERG